MTKIKICGLTSKEDTTYVNEAMPEYVGFVFADSKRKVSLEQAAKLKAQLNPLIQTVGVFVKEPMEQIVELCQHKIIDCVQLHGEEPMEYVAELRKRILNPIIYAKRIRKGEELSFIDTDSVDYLLFDTYVRGSYGGSGRLIDYKQVPRVEKPLFLAGGLNAENVRQAIKAVHPYCVDVSSGVETEGKKDLKKILEFVRCVRENESSSFR